MRKDDVIVILEDARFLYTQEELELFVHLWKEGFSAAIIADRLKTAKYNIALLVMHCDLEGLIEPREGGFSGTIQKQRKKRSNPKKEMMVIK
jgi:hypothetical protein